MRILALLLPSLCFAGSTLILDDFESAATRWQGPTALTQSPVAHGKQALRIRLDGRRTVVSTTTLPGDWRGYDRLLFDLHSDRDSVSTATLRIHDSAGTDFFDAGDKVLILHGWNHVEVSLTPLRASSFLRNLALDRIARLELEFRGPAGTVVLDNLRLVRSTESAETRSRMAPADAVSLIDNRWITARQVARADEVPEAPAVTALRRQAEHEADLLEKTFRTARTQGIETIYEERHLITADLGLRLRPLLSWFNNDRDKSTLFRYVAESCRAGRRALEDRMQGSTLRAEVDDTQMPEPLIPALPPAEGPPRRRAFLP